MTGEDWYQLKDRANLKSKIRVRRRGPSWLYGTLKHIYFFFQVDWRMQHFSFISCLVSQGIQAMLA